MEEIGGGKEETEAPEGTQPGAGSGGKWADLRETQRQKRWDLCSIESALSSCLFCGK